MGDGGSRWPTWQINDIGTRLPLYPMSCVSNGQAAAVEVANHRSAHGDGGGTAAHSGAAHYRQYAVLQSGRLSSSNVISPGVPTTKKLCSNSLGKLAQLYRNKGTRSRCRLDEIRTRCNGTSLCELHHTVHFHTPRPGMATLNAPCLGRWEVANLNAGMIACVNCGAPWKDGVWTSALDV